MSTPAAQPTSYSYLQTPSPPHPVYAESPEISRALFKAATTPSPRVKRRRRDSPRSRSTTPRPEDSRSISSNSHIFENPYDNNPFAPSIKGKEVPVGFGLGLGIPVFPSTSSSIISSPEPLLAWRFSGGSKVSSGISAASPSPTESIDGDAPTPPGDQGSIYTLTPGPAWPPPESSVVSPEVTPRGSLDVEESIFQGYRRSGDSNEMPLSPLTPAITQLLDEIDGMERPPSAGVRDKGVTTVTAWVMDMSNTSTTSLHTMSGREEGGLRVRKVRSWRNLRALGSRTRDFDVVRQAVELPSPPITPPGILEEEDRRDEERRRREEEERRLSVLPDEPAEEPFYDEYEDIIESHLSPAEEEEKRQTFLLDPSPEVERQFQDWPQEAMEEEQETPRPPQVESILSGESFLGSPPAPAPDSPATQLGAFEPMTPDPNSDLVGEIEALLRSSPLRRKEREEARRTESLQSTPTQARIRQAEGAQDVEETPRPLQRPTFPARDTEESLASAATNETVFFTPTEVRTPFFEIPNPMEANPPAPTETRPQTPPTRAVPTTATSSTQSTPTRPPIPTRRSSLSHSRNGSGETIPTKSYPPTSQRPGGHVRGKSIDSSSLYNDRGRTYPPPSTRQRSSSANAVTEDLARGRGRSRSIDDGPPSIPPRKSSVGKTGRPTDLLDTFIRKDSTTAATSSLGRPSLATVLAQSSSAGSHKAPAVTPKASGESLEQVDSNQRFSFSSGIEVLGVGEKAEVVTTDLIRSGSVKEVLVRTSSKGTKPSEFSETPPATIIIAAKKPETPITNASTSTHHVPQFSFGEGPDLTLGESSTTAGKGKERARDQTPLSPTFQLIPPTPAAGDQTSKQLGFEPIPVPGTPSPHQQSPVRKSTPNPLAGVKVVHAHSASDSISSIPLPPRLPSVVHEINGTRPATAPEPLIDFENSIPSPEIKRPSLKNRPTGFKKSKLSPWWRPKYNYFADDYDLHEFQRNGGRYEHECEFEDEERGRDGVRGGKKGRRTVSLGKVQLEFVGVKGLVGSWKEMKEEKKRRKRMGSVTQR